MTDRTAIGASSGDAKTVTRTIDLLTPSAPTRLDTTFLTQPEAAALLRLSERTLERYRLSGTGPAFVKLGRRVVYRTADLMAFADAHTYCSTSEFTA